MGVFERLEAKVEYMMPPDYIKNGQVATSNKDYFRYLIKHYLKHKEKYGGVILTREDASLAKEIFPELVITDTNFYYDLVTWPVANTKLSLLMDINTEIYKLQSEFTVEKICKSYWSSDQIPLCRL